MKNTTKNTAVSVELNETFISAIYDSCMQVWYQCGQETVMMAESEGYEVTNEVCWEVILDAGRLGQIDPVAEKLVDAACEQHGYQRVLRFLGRKVRLG
jgi:hypothetical protein